MTGRRIAVIRRRLESAACGTGQPGSGSPPVAGTASATGGSSATSARGPARHHLPRSVRGSGPYRARRRRSPRTGTVLRPRSSRRRPATSSTSAAITREYRSSPGCTSRKMQANAASLPAWALASVTPKAFLITGPVSAQHTPWRRPNRHLRRLTVAAATELVPLRGLEIPVAGSGGTADLERASEAQDERAAGLTGDPCPEGTADLPENGREPLAVGGPGPVQPHLPGLHRHHAQGGQFPRVRPYRGEVQQAQVVPVRLRGAADAFVVVDAVAAAVEDELAPVGLDRPGVVRGVAVDHVDTAVDEAAGEAGLVTGHVIPPVGAPVDGDDDDVAGLPGGARPGDDLVGGGAGQVGQEIYARPGGGGGPSRGDAAGHRPAGEDHGTAASGHRDDCGLPCAGGVRSGSCGRQPGAGQGTESFR